MRKLFLVSLLAVLACAESPTQPIARTIVKSSLSASDGGNSANAKVCQKNGYKTLYNAYTGLPFENVDSCVSYGAQGNAYSSLVASAPIGTCSILPIPCWGRFSGFGLQPGGLVCSFAWGCAAVMADGTFGPTGTELACGAGWTGVFAVATTWAGATIRSNSVNSPCG